MKQTVKLVLILLLAFLLFHLLTPDGFLASRLTLYRRLLTQSLDEIRNDYANRSCKTFSESEQQSGYFEAFVTGYCKPQAQDFTNREEFLCSTALNCSCPNGLSQEKNCHASSFSWQGCNEFDDQATDYCHQTASTVKPETGHVAADWGCFPKNSQVEIDDQSYTITDKGSLIKGRRFDIWFEDCRQAEKSTGIYQVKIPK